MGVAATGTDWAIGFYTSIMRVDTRLSAIILAVPGAASFFVIRVPFNLMRNALLV
jgi:hypothetical protein